MTIRRERAASYLVSPRSVALHATFVANVKRIMIERGHVYAPQAGNRGGGVSINWLAEASGVPHRTIENLMRENHQPSMVGAAAIAEALGVSMDELCGLATTRTDDDRLTCIHAARHLPHIPVCQKCLTKWQSYQRRLNELHHAARVVAAQAADVARDEAAE